MYCCLFNCDEWKSSNSMNLLMVTNDKLKLLNVIKNEILQGNMCYTRLHNEYESTQEQQAFDWESDQCEYTLNDELNHLIYGYVEELEDGELR